MGRGLDRQKIIDASVDMIDTGGADNFSLHKLADKLGIKTASLYNHVASLNNLMTDVSIEVIHMLIKSEADAIEGKTGDDAIRALAESYFNFGIRHYELYQVFMRTRQPHSKVLEEEGFHIIDPILRTFSGIRISDEEKIHWERILRSILHGFIAQEHAGFFTYHNISSDESFRKAIDCFIAGIHQAESGAKK